MESPLENVADGALVPTGTGPIEEEDDSGRDKDFGVVDDDDDEDDAENVANTEANTTTGSWPHAALKY